jgi:hypothetical protein
MNMNMSRSMEIARVDAAPSSSRTSREVATRPALGAEAMQRAGKRMILAGFIITIAGIVLYCAVCFAGGVDADMGDILLTNAVPFARATLAVLGVGVLVWLVGSFTYLNGAMDADDAASTEPPERDPS